MYRVSKNYYIITAVSDNMRPAMSKAPLHFGFFCDVKQNLEPASTPKFLRSASCRSGLFVL